MYNPYGSMPEPKDIITIIYRQVLSTVDNQKVEEMIVFLLK